MSDSINLTNKSSKGQSGRVIPLNKDFRKLGLLGCSSHSGRRTFITEASRKISLVGGSLRDTHMMVGHESLQTTQRYIEADSESQRKVVDLI